MRGPARRFLRDVSPARGVAAALLAASALLVPACRSVRAAALTAADPAMDAVGGPGASADETCGEQRPRVAPPEDAQAVRIGSWNLHWLGPSGERERETRSATDLAAYVRASGVAALALQEIGVVRTEDGLRAVLLDAVIERLSAHGSRWTYRLRAYPDNPSECTAVAWDTGVFREASPPALLQMPVEPPPLLHVVRAPFQTPLWRRMPFAVHLSAGPGRSDLVLVVAHLTARRRVLFFEDPAAYREREAADLAATLAALRAHYRDDDVVVLGDFNTEFRAEDVADAFLARGWRDLNCADVPTHWLGSAFDRIFVPADQPEFAGPSRFAAHAPEGLGWPEFVRRLSDHRLVAADVLVTRDDD